MSNIENANASGKGGVCGEAIEPKKQKTERKYQRILQMLYDGIALDFQSVRPFGDSCLHSTVSALQNDFGVLIDAAPHSVRGWGGRKTFCKLYKLVRTGENLKRAREILEIAEAA
jgi:hypothetical protein